ncbi:MAG: MerR family transcriptional regulator [Candidatus Binataceae bacterium]
MDGLTIGELAKRAGVNRETVRYYERRRLLPRPPRSASGYRVYSDDAVRRIKFIRRAHALGFSLIEIKELLELRADSQNQRKDVRGRAEAKVRKLEEKIEALVAMKETLARLVVVCATGGTANRCVILDSFEAEK